MMEVALDGLEDALCGRRKMVGKADGLLLRLAPLCCLACRRKRLSTGDKDCPPPFFHLLLIPCLGSLCYRIVAKIFAEIHHCPPPPPLPSPLSWLPAKWCSSLHLTGAERCSFFLICSVSEGIKACPPMDLLQGGFILVGPGGLRGLKTPFLGMILLCVLLGRKATLLSTMCPGFYLPLISGILCCRLGSQWGARAVLWVCSLKEWAYSVAPTLPRLGFSSRSFSITHHHLFPFPLQPQGFFYRAAPQSIPTLHAHPAFSTVSTGCCNYLLWSYRILIKITSLAI